MKQPIPYVIHGLENMEQRIFLHQRNKLSDMDRHAKAKLFFTLDYTLILHLPNNLHHRQLYQ